MEEEYYNKIFHRLCLYNDLSLQDISSEGGLNVVCHAGGGGVVEPPGLWRILEKLELILETLRDEL